MTEETKTKEVQTVTFPIEAVDRTDIESKVTDLLAQTDRVAINNDTDMQKGADLVKFLKNLRKRSDEKRKELTKPFNEQAKAINKEWNPWIEKLDKAVKKVESLMTVYANEVERKKQEERKKLIAEQEARALEEAQRIQDEADKRAEEERKKAEAEAQEAKEAGDHGAAAEIIANAESQAENIRTHAQEIAETTVDNVARSTSIAKAARSAPAARGDFGGIASLKRTLKHELIDITKVPAKFLIVNEAEIRKAEKEYRDLVKETATKIGLKGKEAEAYIFEKMSEFRIAGFRFYWDQNVSVR